MIRMSRVLNDDDDDDDDDVKIVNVRIVIS